jgi:hypothetical protein
VELNCSLTLNVNCVDLWVPVEIIEVSMVLLNYKLKEKSHSTKSTNYSSISKERSKHFNFVL